MKNLNNELVHRQLYGCRMFFLFILFTCQLPFLRVSSEPVKKGDAPAVSPVLSALSAAAAAGQQQQATDQQQQNAVYSKESENEESENHVTYDQRQNGKYNIHVSIKDVAIIEMDQNEIEDSSYGESDYYYDESDLTVKPMLLNPTKITTTTPATTITLTTSPTTTPFIESPTTLKPNDIITTMRTPTTTTNQLTTDNKVNDKNYSPNLLADIAAAHSTQIVNPKFNSTQTFTTLRTPSIPMPTKKVKNVFILDTRAQESNTVTLPNTPTSSMKPLETQKFYVGRSNGRHESEESSIIAEPVLQPKPHFNSTKVPIRHLVENIDTNNSKIYKFRAQHVQQQQQPQTQTQQQLQHIVQNWGFGENGGFGGIGAPAYPLPTLLGFPIRRCRSNQYRDMNGNCRRRRSTSSSLLKKLFHMLIALPLSHHHQNAANKFSSDDYEYVHQYPRYNPHRQLFY